MHTQISFGVETTTHIQHTHCLLRVSRSTVPILGILRNLPMCSYFFLLILVNQLKLINSLTKQPIKTHPMTCFKSLRKRSEQYSLYSSKCRSLFTNRHNSSYDLLKTAEKIIKMTIFQQKIIFFEKLQKPLLDRKIGNDTCSFKCRSVRNKPVK